MVFAAVLVEVVLLVAVVRLWLVWLRWRLCSRRLGCGWFCRRCLRYSNLAGCPRRGWFRGGRLRAVAGLAAVVLVAVVLAAVVLAAAVFAAVHLPVLAAVVLAAVVFAVVVFAAATAAVVLAAVVFVVPVLVLSSWFRQRCSRPGKRGFSERAVTRSLSVESILGATVRHLSIGRAPASLPRLCCTQTDTSGRLPACPFLQSRRSCPHP